MVTSVTTEEMFENYTFEYYGGKCALTLHVETRPPFLGSVSSSEDQIPCTFWRWER